MIGLLINLLIVALILGVAWWILSLIPLPPPFGMVVQVVFVIICLIVVISLLASLGGVGWQPLWRG